MMEDNLLEIRELTVSIIQNKEALPIVKGIDMDVPRGSIVGLVGESGCGKSMSAKSINGILPHAAHIVKGSVLWKEKQGETVDLVRLSEKKLRKYCGSRIAMIFQEPMTSLNPLMRVGDQIREVLTLHKLERNPVEAKKKVIKMLEAVGIDRADMRYNSYPHQLSGGMRQRVMIAMAMIASPKLLIADEPTTALDVTIEAQILKLIKEMCSTYNMSALVITHNMGVVASICDQVYVMYMGTIVERASVKELFSNPCHPYTRGLLSSIPRIGHNPEYLNTIPGNVPDIRKSFAGCDFCLRCSDDIRSCFFDKPKESKIREGHYVRCHTVLAG